jgi:hypothetical protein
LYVQQEAKTKVTPIKKAYRLYATRQYGQSKHYARRIKVVKLYSVSVLLIAVCTLAMFIGYTSGSTPSSNLTTSIRHKKTTRTLKTNKPTSTVAVPSKVPAVVHSLGSAVLTTPAWTKLPLYTDPTNEASTYYQSNPTVNGAALIEREGEVPVSEWFGDWNTDIQSDVDAYVSSATGANAVPVLVLYNIPDRDCGGTSAGGAANASAYVAWVQQVAATIGDREAVIILEPDALGGADCLSSSDQQARFGAMSQAVSTLKADPNVFVYIDAGNPSWEPVGLMAQRLQAANISQADGFSLNVSYFDSTAQNQAYGDQLSKLVGNKHYVIDTSRNGASGSFSGTVCNPSNGALGSLPSVITGDPLNDAFLWIKIPWESDGPCNGGPAPGGVFWTYALQLAANAGW